jgi:hypothetical protein
LAHGLLFFLPSKQYRRALGEQPRPGGGARRMWAQAVRRLSERVAAGGSALGERDPRRRSWRGVRRAAARVGAGRRWALVALAQPGGVRV